MDWKQQPTFERVEHTAERLQALLEHVADGIVELDERGDVAAFNPAAERIFGHDAGTMTGRSAARLLAEPPDGGVAGLLALFDALDGNGSSGIVGRHRDGGALPLELVVVGDRTERRRYTLIVRERRSSTAEPELRRLREELANADRQKNDFLAMLAHELRNPLAPMRNSLHLLRMRGASEEIAQHARDVLERQMQHLVRLVDDLLDVSRIIRGKIELRRETLDVAVAVARAIETARPAIEAKEQQLSVALPDPAVWVEADLMRLAQIVASLLDNASKYTPRSGRIALSVSRDGEHAVISVRDTVRGIASDALGRVFDLFVQGGASPARAQGGLGIGLTLVKRLAELHGGTVGVRSDGPGQGSEFVVRLPALAARGAAAARERAGESAPTEQRRILVVDDNVDAAESIAMILRLDGFDVRCVYDGLSVVSTARAYHPHVILLDIGLPGISGYEVVGQLREQPEFRDTLILAVTGYGQEADRRRAEEAGFDHHLTKPVDPGVLETLLRRGSGH